MVLDNILGHKDVDPDNLVGPLPFLILQSRSFKGEQYQLPLASSPQLRRYPRNPPSHLPPSLPRDDRRSVHRVSNAETPGSSSRRGRSNRTEEREGEKTRNATPELGSSTSRHHHLSSLTSGC